MPQSHSLSLTRHAAMTLAALASIGCGTAANAQCVVNWTLRATTGPSVREDARMVYDPVSEKVILFGGANYNSGVRFNDTWEWNGTAWTQRFPGSTLPPARGGHGMAYDRSRDRVVLFGGNLPNNSTNYADTWEYDGSNWTNVANGTPAKRYHPGLAFDAARNVTMMVGGQTDLNQAYREAWAWDGSTWLRESNAAPAQGYGVSFDYDRTRRVGIFFGGTTYFGNLARFNETWEWNGSAWNQRFPVNSPPARRFAPMVFDPARDAMVLFGGDAQGNVFVNDTWTWDGTNWNQLAVTGPSARRTAAMAYDEARGEIVLFGGFDTAIRNDTWVLPSPLGFVRQPSATGVCPGGDATIEVRAVGVSAISYQWRRDTQPIDPVLNPSAASPTLTIMGAQQLDEGSYDCVITSSCGTKTSQAVDFSLCRSDLNCDTLVTDDDFLIFAAAYNVLACDDPAMPAGCPSDLNADTIVDDLDFLVFVQAYNLLVCG